MKSHSLDSRRTRGLPGGSYWFGVLGTRGVLARHPGELSRRGIRGHVAAREVSGRGGFTLRHSGQVSLSEGLSGRGFGGGFERRHSARLWVGSGYRSGFGDTCQTLKGLRKGLSVGFRRGFRRTFIDGLGINGWDFSVRSDRGEVRSD